MDRAPRSTRTTMAQVVPEALRAMMKSTRERRSAVVSHRVATQRVANVPRAFSCFRSRLPAAVSRDAISAAASRRRRQHVSQARFSPLTGRRPSHRKVEARPWSSCGWTPRDAAKLTASSSHRRQPLAPGDARAAPPGPSSRAALAGARPGGHAAARIIEPLAEGVHAGALRPLAGGRMSARSAGSLSFVIKQRPRERTARIRVIRAVRAGGCAPPRIPARSRPPLTRRSRPATRMSY